MDEIIHFRYIMFVLKKRWKFILFTTSIITFIATILSYYFITPIYDAKSELIVYKKGQNNELTSVDSEMSALLIDTYRIIIKSPRILEKVEEKLKGNGIGEINPNKIVVNRVEHSQVFIISTVSSDPYKAALIVNTVATTFIEEVGSILGNKNVQILTPATVGHTPSPIKPNLTFIAIVTFFLLLVVSTTIAFLLEKINAKFHDVQEIYDEVGIKIIGNIRRFKGYQSDGELLNEKGDTSD